MMAGVGVGGGQTPSSSLYADTISVSAKNHINEADLFLHSNASDLLPCEFSVNAVNADHSSKRNNGEMTSQQSMHYRQDVSDLQKKHVNDSYYSKGYSDDQEIFTNKKRGKTKKKSNSTISSNTSSSYSSSSGVESMTAGINGLECNNMSDKSDKNQETCSSVLDCSKENTYAVGQWLGFLQMDNYLQDFLDNGYDDLETVKQIGTDDLDAIGVINKHHRAFILDAVQVLREQGAVWVYLLQARDNPEKALSDGSCGQYNPMDSLLNHSGSSFETSSRDRLSGGSGNGDINSYPSSANSSFVPWGPNGVDSHTFGLKTSESSQNQSPIMLERNGKKPFIQNHQMNFGTKEGMACSSTPTKYAYKENNSAKFLSSQHNSSLRAEDEDLIQRVSDVMKIEQCDKLVKMSGDNGLNTTSSTSSNHSQKSSESSNSFYASIPNMPTVNNQSKTFDPVISLMLSNNQPPLQLQNGISFGDKNDKINDQQYRKELLARKELQMHPTYANFIAKNQVNGTKPFPPVRNLENKLQGYSPGTYASSSCLSDREEEDLYDFAAKYEGGRGMPFGRNYFGGQTKPKLSPSGWYKTAKRLINAKNSSKDDLSLIEGPKDWQGYKSDLGSRIGSPILGRDSSDMNGRFSTRTRLRPGGPLSNVTNARDSYLRSPHGMANHPNRGYMATMRNGSLPSMTMCEFEEIGMKTMQGVNPVNQQRVNGQVPNLPMNEDFYPISARNRLNHFGHFPESPATPLVKLRTNTKTNESAILNEKELMTPRVQMYGTRVVYSDKDSNASAGIITNNKHATLGMAGNKSNFATASKKIPEAAV